VSVHHSGSSEFAGNPCVPLGEISMDGQLRRVEELMCAGSIGFDTRWTTEVARCRLPCPNEVGLAVFPTAAIAEQAHRTMAATSSVNHRRRGAARCSAAVVDWPPWSRAFSAQLTSMFPGVVSTLGLARSTGCCVFCVGVSGDVIVIGNLPSSLSSFSSERYR